MALIATRVPAIPITSAISGVYGLMRASQQAVASNKATSIAVGATVKR
jgi:hypothetical protein